MKNLIFILLLLLPVSCGVFKNKSKEKSKTESEIKAHISAMENTSISETKTVAKTDSSVSDFKINAQSTAATISQNFSLKQNGKCADGGETRFVSFTDKNGNKTEIPVNDNTELNFNNTDAVLAENKELHSTVSQLKSENNKLRSELSTEKENNSKISATKNESNIRSDVETKKNPLISYVFIAFAAIVFWEFGKRQLKL